MVYFYHVLISLETLPFIPEHNNAYTLLLCGRMTGCGVVFPLAESKRVL